MFEIIQALADAGQVGEEAWLLAWLRDQEDRWPLKSSFRNNGTQISSVRTIHHDVFSLGYKANDEELEIERTKMDRIAFFCDIL